jgi:hypothetical protein
MGGGKLFPYGGETTLPSTSIRERMRHWIPAFAGMTNTYPIPCPETRLEFLP